MCWSCTAFTLYILEFVDAFFTKNIDWIDISAACLGGFFTYIIYYYFKTHRPIK